MNARELLKAKTAKLRQILPENFDVEAHTTTPETPLSDALVKVAQLNIGALAVVSPEGAVCGILSERDVVRVLSARGTEALADPVSSAMTADPVCATADTGARDMLIEMVRGRFRHVPVVEEGRLVGLLMSLDIANLRLSETTSQSRAMDDLVTKLVGGRAECGADDDIALALERMTEQDLPCIPVREEEKVLGVITSCDIFKLKIGEKSAAPNGQQ